MRSFVKIKPSRNGKITLSFIDIGKSCLNREFLSSLICLLILFAKIKFSRKFPNLQYVSDAMKVRLVCWFDCLSLVSGQLRDTHMPGSLKVDLKL